MRVCHLFILTLAATLVASCDSKSPAAPTAPAPSPTPAPSPGPEPTFPYPMFLFFGTVRDGTGRPVADAIVESGPDSGTTDGNGHYEFRGTYPSAAGRVRPPDGYEPNPKRPTNTFPVNAGGQDFVVRRITRVTLTYPTAVSVGTRGNVGIEIGFDTGAVEYPYTDAFSLFSSDSSVLRAVGGGPTPFVEGVKAGTAQVTGRYRGVSSAALTVQVVSR